MLRFFAPFFIVLLLCAPCDAGLPLKAAILCNMNSGAILFERNANASLAPASLTKIMTMFLALDAVKAGKISLNDKIAIPPLAAKTGGSAMGLAAGEKVPLVRLLAGMAVSSGNDAATATALRLGGSIANFARMMNNKARRLGMKNTVFKNPTGLPAAGHKSTARDLLTLCRAYFKTHPKAMRFHSMTFFMHKGRVARNTNHLLGRLAGVDGLKTGWTAASGYNLVITAKRGKTRLLAIVLGCPTKQARDEAAAALLEAGFAHPHSPNLVKKELLANPQAARKAPPSGTKKDATLRSRPSGRLWSVLRLNFFQKNLNVTPPQFRRKNSVFRLITARASVLPRSPGQIYE